ncbi:MAG: S-adenosylmethionine decarboxylase proenzyme [Microscillaceae bacterium]|nr:S-adenosylmethionine decarboxylase proenzyme [Microscillaceae bacterium]
MKALGNHILVEFYNCNRDIMNDAPFIEKAMNDAAIMSGATVVGSHFHTFSPHGVSGVVVIAESHLSIHTWPEYGYAAVDIFTCGETIDADKAFEHLKTSFQAGHTSTLEMKRGQLHDIDGELHHKPMPHVAHA